MGIWSVVLSFNVREMIKCEDQCFGAKNYVDVTVECLKGTANLLSFS